jgi:hypothetical protein
MDSKLLLDRMRYSKSDENEERFNEPWFPYFGHGNEEDMGKITQNTTARIRAAQLFIQSLEEKQAANQVSTLEGTANAIELTKADVHGINPGKLNALPNPEAVEAIQRLDAQTPPILRRALWRRIGAGLAGFGLAAGIIIAPASGLRIADGGAMDGGVALAQTDAVERGTADGKTYDIDISPNDYRKRVTDYLNKFDVGGKRLTPDQIQRAAEIVFNYREKHISAIKAAKENGLKDIPDEEKLKLFHKNLFNLNPNNLELNIPSVRELFTGLYVSAVIPNNDPATIDNLAILAAAKELYLDPIEASKQFSKTSKLPIERILPKPVASPEPRVEEVAGDKSQESKIPINLPGIIGITSIAMFLFLMGKGLKTRLLNHFNIPTPPASPLTGQSSTSTPPVAAPLAVPLAGGIVAPTVAPTSTPAAVLPTIGIAAPPLGTQSGSPNLVVQRQTPQEQIVSDLKTQVPDDGFIESQDFASLINGVFIQNFQKNLQGLNIEAINTFKDALSRSSNLDIDTWTGCLNTATMALFLIQSSSDNNPILSKFQKMIAQHLHNNKVVVDNITRPTVDEVTRLAQAMHDLYTGLQSSTETIDLFTKIQRKDYDIKELLKTPVAGAASIQLFIDGTKEDTLLPRFFGLADDGATKTAISLIHSLGKNIKLEGDDFDPDSISEYPILQKVLQYITYNFINMGEFSQVEFRNLANLLKGGSDPNDKQKEKLNNVITSLVDILKDDNKINNFLGVQPTTSP